MSLFSRSTTVSFWEECSVEHHVLFGILGSRRLITYRRLPEGETSDVSVGRRKADSEGIYADELNAFRRKVGTFPSVLLLQRIYD